MKIAQLYYKQEKMWPQKVLLTSVLAILAICGGESSAYGQSCYLAGGGGGGGGGVQGKGGAGAAGYIGSTPTSRSNRAGDGRGAGAGRGGRGGW